MIGLILRGVVVAGADTPCSAESVGIAGPDRSVVVDDILLGCWQRAISRNDVGSIVSWLDSAAGDSLAAHTDAQGKTALMAAARAADGILLERLLRTGGDIDARNANGGTALMYAAVNGDRRILTYLLEAGANPDLQSRNGWSTATIAASKGFTDLLVTLHSYGARLQLADIQGWTPLMRAVANNRVEAVRYLLTLPSTDISHRDKLGSTAVDHLPPDADRRMVLLLTDRSEMHARD